MTPVWLYVGAAVVLLVSMMAATRLREVAASSLLMELEPSEPQAPASAGQRELQGEGSL